MLGSSAGASGVCTFSCTWGTEGLTYFLAIFLALAFSAIFSYLGSPGASIAIAYTSFEALLFMDSACLCLSSVEPGLLTFLDSAFFFSF